MSPSSWQTRVVGLVPTLDTAFARATPALAFVIAVFATIGRQEGVPKIRTIWAEDGTIFGACAYAHNVFACIAEPYNGWIHLIPRVGAQIAVLAPPAMLPLALTLVAASITGVAAAITAADIRDASGSWMAGLTAGASLVLVWQAALEISGNVTNLPWMLLAASISVLVSWWVGHRLRAYDYALLLAAGLSTAFAPFLPAMALVGVTVRRPGAMRVLLVTAAAAVVQAYVGLTSPRTPPAGLPFDLIETVRVFGRDVILHGPFGLTRIPPGWLVAAGAGLVCLLAGGRYVQARGDGVGGAEEVCDARRAVLATAGIVIVGSATFVVAIFLQKTFNPRYTYIASVLFCTALVFGAALIGRGARSRTGTRPSIDRWTWWGARLALPVAVLTLALGFAGSFRIETRSSNGPDVVAAYDAISPTCSSGDASVRLPISPINADNWVIDIPCDRITGSP